MRGAKDTHRRIEHNSELIPGSHRITRLPRPESETVPSGESVGVITAKHTLTAGQDLPAQIARPRRVTRLPRPPGETVPSGKSVRMSTARHTIAEVEQLVDAGAIDPDHVHTPGIFVKRLLQGPSYEKLIEKRTTRVIRPEAGQANG